MKFAVIYEKAERNWAAYVPDLPGCITTGPSLHETQVNIREAIEGHLQTMIESGCSIPEPTSVAGEVEVTTAA